ncbi:hypothetical protein PV797_14755 [Clostridiaceae bacterium M8S5]|nr:hypothetical protein PV797_14755 [Clostridiaceae bacterium M8S5]
MISFVLGIIPTILKIIMYEETIVGFESGQKIGAFLGEGLAHMVILYLICIGLYRIFKKKSMTITIILVLCTIVAFGKIGNELKSIQLSNVENKCISLLEGKDRIREFIKEDIKEIKYGEATEIMILLQESIKTLSENKVDEIVDYDELDKMLTMKTFNNIEQIRLYRKSIEDYIKHIDKSIDKYKIVTDDLISKLNEIKLTNEFNGGFTKGFLESHANSTNYAIEHGKVLKKLLISKDEILKLMQSSDIVRINGNVSFSSKEALNKYDKLIMKHDKNIDEYNEVVAKVKIKLDDMKNKLNK